MVSASKVRRNGYMTGMQGVYLTAAEITGNGLIVSPTSRSSYGADLLVTDQECKKAWSVQVKTNFGRPKFWLLSKHSKNTASPSHIYVLVNLCRGNERQKKLYHSPDYYVVPSDIVAKKFKITRRKNSTFYFITLDDLEEYKSRWSVFE